MTEFADALRERRGVGGLLHLRHDDGELVAAHARDDVELARAAAQTLADKFEQLIADMVTERIVDALELIEVEAQHRQALAALDALDLVVELLQQEHRGWAGRSAHRGAPCARCVLRSAGAR